MSTMTARFALRLSPALSLLVLLAARPAGAVVPAPTAPAASSAPVSGPAVVVVPVANVLLRPEALSPVEDQAILGETLEAQRFFEQALAGRTDLLGRRTEGVGKLEGHVLSTRWIE